MSDFDERYPHSEYSLAVDVLNDLIHRMLRRSEMSDAILLYALEMAEGKEKIGNCVIFR